MLVDSHSLAWAAGFLDGEGCIRLDRRERKGGRHIDFQLQVTVVNTDIRALLKFREMFGGSIQPLVKPGHPKFKPAWTWWSSHRIAAACLEALAPWLVIKREQAELALLSRKYVHKTKRSRTPQENVEMDWLRRRLSDLKHTPMAAPELPGRGIIRAEEKLLWDS